jgi:hypothetical protein
VNKPIYLIVQETVGQHAGGEDFEILLYDLYMNKTDLQPKGQFSVQPLNMVAWMCREKMFTHQGTTRIADIPVAPKKLLKNMSGEVRGKINLWIAQRSMDLALRDLRSLSHT